MKNPPKIEECYRRADKLVDDLDLNKEDKELLRAELNQLLVAVHNSVVMEMKENALLEIAKSLDKFGYKQKITL